MINIYC